MAIVIVGGSNTPPNAPVVTAPVETPKAQAPAVKTPVAQAPVSAPAVIAPVKTTVAKTPESTPVAAKLPPEAKHCEHIESILKPIVASMVQQAIPYPQDSANEWRDCSGNFLRLTAASEGTDDE